MFKIIHILGPELKLPEDSRMEINKIWASRHELVVSCSQNGNICELILSSDFTKDDWVMAEFTLDFAEADKVLAEFTTSGPQGFFPIAGNTKAAEAKIEGTTAAFALSNCNKVRTRHQIVVRSDDTYGFSEIRCSTGNVKFSINEAEQTVELDLSSFNQDTDWILACDGFGFPRAFSIVAGTLPACFDGEAVGLYNWLDGESDDQGEYSLPNASFTQFQVNGFAGRPISVLVNVL